MTSLMTIDQALTMSSREIADLTGKRHDNVMVLCRSLRDIGVCPEIQETPYVNEQNGQTYLECRLGKRDSLVLIARISPEFTAAVVDRWQELEADFAPKVPTTMAQALRLAAEQAELLEQQQAQIEAAKPKVEFVDKFVQSSTGSKGFREVCKLLKANEAEFRCFVIDRRIMYRLGGKLTAHQNHIDAGRFEVKAGVAGNDHAYTTTKFTAKGAEWVSGEWAKHKLSVTLLEAA